MGVREAQLRRRLTRGYTGFREGNPDEEFAAQIRETEREADKLSKELRARKDAGETVAADDWPATPDRLTIAKALNRKAEYHAHYAAASWLAHPGVPTVENVLRETEDGRLEAGEPARAHGLAGMAASLARMAYARVARRVCAALGQEAQVKELDAFMAPRGIGATGVVEDDRFTG